MSWSAIDCFSLAEQVFDYMKENDKLSPPTYTSYFSILGKAGQSKKAIREFNELPMDSEVRLNVYVCNSILSTMIYNGKIDKAFRLFEELKSEGLKPDTVTYSTVSLESALLFDGGLYNGYHVISCSIFISYFFVAFTKIKNMIVEH